MMSKNNGVIYIGVTNDLVKRVWEHKSSIVPGFTSRYKVFKLVYFEQFDDIQIAREREVYLKGKKRQFKLDLILSQNPGLEDLYLGL